MRAYLDKTLSYLFAQGSSIKLAEDVRELLVQLSNGDVRVLLTSLDTLLRAGVQSATSDELLKILQENPIRYDKKGDEHYDTISAFIKSMRASDADAALYYLARMVDAGEDPKFIARRMVIFASEDIGLADPQALTMANNVFRACETIGYPEAQINLAHGVCYLCKASKDRSSYNAYFAALDDVHTHGNLEVPLKIRNAPTSLMKDLGYGKGYIAYPNKPGSYLPEKLRGKKYLK
jgi:putative ATPase